MQSSIAEAKAEMERMESKLMNDTEIAHFKRDYDFKKAGYDVEVNTAKANADLAYTLQVGFSFALFGKGLKNIYAILAENILKGI